MVDRDVGVGHESQLALAVDPGLRLLKWILPRSEAIRRGVRPAPTGPDTDTGRRPAAPALGGRQVGAPTAPATVSVPVYEPVSSRGLFGDDLALGQMLAAGLVRHCDA